MRKLYRLTVPFVSKRAAILFCSIFFTPFLYAQTFTLPAKGNIIGENKFIHPHHGETLIELGLHYDLGYEDMVRANPKINPNWPLSHTETIRLPMQFTLPKAPRKGIVIQLSSYRLYFYPNQEDVVMTFPIGVGRSGWNTPIGVTKVLQKIRNPIWHPSANLRQHAEESGVLFPEEFPANAANPLGQYALKLGFPMILIHGTNQISGVGMKVSAGCIRMLPEDIETLFGQVQQGTLVRILP